MKKFLAMFLAVTLLLSLTACGEKNPSQTGTEAPTAPAENPTEGTPTQPPEATEPSLESRFKTYPAMYAELGNFLSLEELDAYRIFRWCQLDLKPASTDSIWDSETSTQKILHTYSVEALNAKTQTHFGRTWDYAAMVKTDLYDEAEYHYDAGAKMVVVTYYGASGGPSEGEPQYTFQGYTALDDTHFEIVYSKKYYDKTVDVTMVVEQVEGKYLLRSQDMYCNIFKNYPAVVTVDEMYSLGFFESAEELTASRVFRWAQEQISPVSTAEDALSYTYSVPALHDLTTRYFGRMFDYATAQKDNGSEKVTYDVDAQTVTVTYVGGMGGMDFETTYVGYERIDDTHFVITYKTNYDEYPTYDYSEKDVVMEVEMAEGDFIILSHKKA